MKERARINYDVDLMLQRDYHIQGLAIFSEFAKQKQKIMICAPDPDPPPSRAQGFHSDSVHHYPNDRLARVPWVNVPSVN